MTADANLRCLSNGRLCGTVTDTAIAYLQCEARPSSCQLLKALRKRRDTRGISLLNAVASDPYRIR